MIGSDGKVLSSKTAIGAGSTLHSEPVERCITNAINALVFPAAGGQANVNYPFVFSSGSD